jgi:hypothetical protein
MSFFSGQARLGAGVDTDSFSVRAPSITEIFSMADFPEPVAGVITLPTGKYLIKDNLVTADRFYVGPGSVVTLEIDDARNNSITYIGVGTFLTSMNPARLIIQEFQVVLASPGSTLLEVCGGVFVWSGGAGVCVNANQSLGAVRYMTVAVLEDISFFGFTTGFTGDQNNITFYRQLVMNSNGTGTGSFLTFDDGFGTFASYDNVVVEAMGASETMFDLRACLKTRVTIRDVQIPDVDQFFKGGTTGAIASFTDVSTSTTAVTVTDDSGDALFTSNSHGLNDGEIVQHTTFTQTSYNGDYFVVSNATTNTYKVEQGTGNLPYVADDSGLFATTTCQVNDVGHGLSDGECLSIFGTINLGGGYKIFNSQTDTFEISLGKAFPGSESTGNWDTSSLDEKSPYVTATDNGAQKDSANIGAFVIGGNTAETEIDTQGDFEDLDLGTGASPAGDIEQWTLSNSVTGELRYDGVFPVSATYSGLVSVVSAGAANLFEFRLLKNGSPLPAPDNVDIPIDVGITLQSFAIFWSVEIEPGDLFRIQVANTEGTSNITVDTIKVSVS